MSLFQIVIAYFAGLLISLIFFYLIGKGIRFWWYKTFSFNYLFADIFFSLLVGLVAVVFSYAIICTQGITIQWLFLLLAFFFWWERKQDLERLKTEKPKQLALKPLLPSLIALFAGVVFCFGWEAFFFLKTGDFPFHLPFVDTPFYSKVAHFLSVTGSENTANMERWFEGKPSNGIALYHYFELWLNNFIVNGLGLLDMPTYILVIQPLFYFVGLVGILALLERKSTFGFLHLFWAILLLFTSVVFFDFYPKMEKLQYIDIIFFNFLGHLSKKTGTYYVCMLAFALLFEQKKYTQAFYTLFCLPIMTVTMLPAVIGGTWLFLILSFFFRFLPAQPLKKIGISSILFFVTYLFLYQIMKDKEAVFTLNHSFSSLSPFGLSDLFTKIKLAVGTLAQVFLLFLPYLLLVLAGKFIHSITFSAGDGKSEVRKQTWKLMYDNHKGIVIAFVSILVAGIVTWALFFTMRDGFQLFSGTLSAISVLMMVLIVQYIDIFSFSLAPPLPSPTGRKNLSQISILLLNLLLISLLSYNLWGQIKRQKHQYNNSNNYFTRGNPHSTNYLKKIQEKVDNEQIKGFGGCLMDNELLEKSFYPYQVSLHFIKLGDYLYLMTNQAFVVSMHDLNKEDLENSKVAVTEALPFYQFAAQQKKADTFQNIPQSQVDFIQKYKLRFLILSNKYALDAVFEPLIQETITDESSGERFIVLKKI